MARRIIWSTAHSRFTAVGRALFRYSPAVFIAAINTADWEAGETVLAALTMAYAAATPIAGAPRTESVLIASHASSTSLSEMMRTSSGNFRWSTISRWPLTPPTHWIVGGRP